VAPNAGSGEAQADRWALILGVSSGFGAAAARAFAREGMGILGVHLDRRAALPGVEALQAELRACGVPVAFFNVNAAAADKRAAVLDSVRDHVGEGTIGVLLHSLAFGTLRPFVPPPGSTARVSTQRNVDMTLDVMAHSLVYWVQDLVGAGLLGAGGRVFAMTSGGSQRVFPSYGPVSAAKAALESHVRQLALELAPHRITVNAVMAGVTDTPALRKIPGHEDIMAQARARNPHGRLTRPDDVASCLVALSGPGTHWLTGNVLQVDGGELVSA
jgi:NAD(P)-dependent dehydrogenase (short-subunit alcohol dehydrogenase family)